MADTQKNEWWVGLPDEFQNDIEFEETSFNNQKRK
jgi:hypothetical protein